MWWQSREWIIQHCKKGDKLRVAYSAPLGSNQSRQQTLLVWILTLALGLSVGEFLLPLSRFSHLSSWVWDIVKWFILAHADLVTYQFWWCCWDEIKVQHHRTGESSIYNCNTNTNNCNTNNCNTSCDFYSVHLCMGLVQNWLYTHLPCHNQHFCMLMGKLVEIYIA